MDDPFNPFDFGGLVPGAVGVDEFSKAADSPKTYTQIFPAPGYQFWLSKHEDGSDCLEPDIEHLKVGEKPSEPPKCGCNVDSVWS